ncbi:MAG: putative membrane protein YhhN [Rhodothermales bacterium]|jgi:uncharacterized membrane protein YhhN
MVTAALVLFSVISLLVLLRAERLGYRQLVYVAKPLTMVSIGLIAVFAWPAVSPDYQRLILIGLGLSLAGDIALMLPKDRFLAGLGAFLVAHVAYTAAFLGRLEAIPALPFLPFALAGLFVVRLLWRHLDRLRWPVVIYATAIAAMAGSAWAVAMTLGTTSAWLGAIGASLFVVSDTVLGFNRFVGEISSSQSLILWTYFPAQVLIAISVFA